MTRAACLCIFMVLLLASGAHAAPPQPDKKPPSTAKPKPAASASGKTVRTLEAIRIDGEVDVPQVLFISARDRRRFRDGLGASYLGGVNDAARCVMPERVRVVARPAP